MPKPVLSSRSRIPDEIADGLLRCYAERLPPSEAAKSTGLSLNTLYEQYGRLRWRLIEVGYYQDAALSKTEDGLSKSAQEKIRLRRGIEGDDIYAHAAEVIEWEEEWPPNLVLRHLRKIIELTGPIDVVLAQSTFQADVVTSYVQYARTQLIHDRVAKNAESDPSQQDFLKRVSTAVNSYRKDYRASLKRMSRQNAR
jgi:hypothetical protein